MSVDTAPAIREFKGAHSFEVIRGRFLKFVLKIISGFHFRSPPEARGDDNKKRERSLFFVILSEAKDPCSLITHLLFMNSRESILLK